MNLDGDANGPINDTGVEINVGIELLFNEVGVLQSNLFQFLRVELLLRDIGPDVALRVVSVELI